MILCVFVMYQKQLGEDSFWEPWISAMPDVTFFSDWPREAIMKTMDPYLINDAVRERETNQRLWQLLEPALK
jgi:hypothetical protein